MNSPEQAVALYRWANVIATLSLDVAEPFLRKMGFPVPPNYKQGVREIIKELRTEGIDPELSQQYAERLLAWTAETYGLTLSNYLHVWTMAIFKSGELTRVGRSISTWMFVINDLFKRTPLLETPPFIVQVRLLMQIQRNTESIYAIRPFTAWDLSIYEWREYDDMVDAMLFVDSTIDCYNFVSAWNRLRDDASSGYSTSEIFEWGKDAALKCKVSADDLGNPEAWPVLSRLLEPV